jgi:hypothetical protein
MRQALDRLLCTREFEKGGVWGKSAAFDFLN